MQFLVPKELGNQNIEDEDLFEKEDMGNRVLDSIIVIQNINKV